jgi:hypothetical protein
MGLKNLNLAQESGDHLDQRLEDAARADSRAMLYIMGFCGKNTIIKTRRQV